MIKLTPGKSHLITGVSQSWQGAIARQSALEYAKQGTAIIEVVDSEADRAAAMRDMAALCTASEIAPASIKHKVVFATSDFDALAAAIVRASERAKANSYMLYRDLSLRTLPTLPGNSCLTIADMIAGSFHVPVLTATCDGVHKLTRPNSEAYRGHIVYVCSETPWDGLAPQEPGVHITFQKVWPDVGKAIQLRGATNVGTILFDQEKDYAHAA